MPTSTTVLPIAELREAVAAELEWRRRDKEEFSYADKRDDVETLYGLTGAVNIVSALGLAFGGRRQKRSAAERILSYQAADGSFHGDDGPGHAVHTVLGALSLLGEPVPANAGPLAPKHPSALRDWIRRHDWTSTHKELCGQTIPLLASGAVAPEWAATFVEETAKRLDPRRPRETWCSADAPPWRVISCAYHVLSTFDAGRIPYPQPELLMRRLLDLHWDTVAEDEHRTVCTDGDWALLLLELSKLLPSRFAEVMEAITRVSARRVRDWHENREAILSTSTHHLYCYLWVTAVFQATVRAHYATGVVIDTLNNPALFRLRPI